MCIRDRFGYEGVSEETVNEIAELQLDYLKLNGTRRPEIVYNTTYSVTDANEVYNYIDKANSIYDRAYELLERIPERIKDSYYQIVLYQAAGSANVNLMSLYSALNGMYSSAGSVLANKYAVLVNECIERDTQMQTCIRDRYRPDAALVELLYTKGVGHIRYAVVQSAERCRLYLSCISVRT